MKASSTILGLMGAVAFVAVGLTTLRFNDEFLAYAIFALTMFSLCTATLVAFYRRGAWAGFAVFGWAQFVICQAHQAPPEGPASIPPERGVSGALRRARREGLAGTLVEARRLSDHLVEQ